MKLHVVMLSTRSYSPSLVSIPNVSAYCEKWDYTFKVYKRLLNKDWVPSWNKILALERELRHCPENSWMLWIDADVLIVQEEISLDFLSNVDKDFAFSIDSSGLCCGFFLLRNCQLSRWLLHELHTMYSPTWPWEQSAIKKIFSSEKSLIERTIYISDQFVQNPRSRFSSKAFAVHFWYQGQGASLTVERMKAVSKRGWSRETYALYFAKLSRVARSRSSLRLGVGPQVPAGRRGKTTRPANRVP